MSTAKDPKPISTISQHLQSIAEWCEERPLAHFVLGEAIAGIASLSVYGFFLAFSRGAEWLTEKIPLSYKAPALFLDHIIAWGTAISGAVTFAVITLISVIRLSLKLWRTL